MSDRPPIAVPVEALLAERSPLVRRIVLVELMRRPADDAEVRELEALRDRDPFFQSLATTPAAIRKQPFRRTLRELRLLGYLRVDAEWKPLRIRAEAVFALQNPDGSWPIERFCAGERADGSGYTMVPLQTAIPLRSLGESGFATDRRCERAFEWLLAQRLDDGSWPTGRSGGVYGRVAGYRKLAHSRWGCRSNTTGALAALATHPALRTDDVTRRAADHVLASLSLERNSLGFELARLFGVEPDGGVFTYYGRIDAAFLLSLASAVGIGVDDSRVEHLVNHIRDATGPAGLVVPGEHPHLSRLLTIDVLRSLARLATAERWLESEPETPHVRYRLPPRRY